MYIHSPLEIVIDASAVSIRKDVYTTCNIKHLSGTDTCYKSKEDNIHKICYKPFKEGNHTIDITYDGLPVPESPFKVNVLRGCDPKKVKAFGPGLEQAIVNQVNSFYIDTKKAGRALLNVMILKPPGINISPINKKDGIFVVKYKPITNEPIEISVKFDDQNIIDSPFLVNCTASVDASKVKAYGPGVEPNQCRAGKPIPFTVDATKSGKAPLDVQVSSEKGSTMSDLRIKEQSSVVVEMSAKQAKQKADNLPKFRSDPNKVTSKGMGLKRAHLHISNQFTVNCVDAGNNLLFCSVYGPKGSHEEVVVKPIGQNMYQVNYTVKEKGDHVVAVKWGDDHIPGSPFKVEAS